MKNNIKYVCLVACCSLLLCACGSSKTNVSKQTIEEANTLAQQGQYTQAYEKYASQASYLITDSASLRLATISASEIKQDSAAYTWGKIYSSAGDTAKLKALASSMQNLGYSTERTLLIIDNEEEFKTILGTAEVTKTEAYYYAETKDTLLLTVYPTLEDNDTRTALFDQYFAMLKKSDATDAELQKVCKAQLKINSEQKVALKYMGTTKYERANKLYNKAMDDYNKEKTQAAYPFLKPDPTNVKTPAYKESCNYFERLHKVDPENKDVIKYLISIYSRLDNKTKVQQLKKQL